MSKVIEFKPKTTVAHNAEQTGSYQFTEKPVAKSSTNVALGGTVCPSCGCPKGAGTVQQRAEREIAARANCNCKCHGRR